jgi:hypothetical protein
MVRENHTPTYGPNVSIVVKFGTVWTTQHVLAHPHSSVCFSTVGYDCGARLMLGMTPSPYILESLETLPKPHPVA